VGRSDGNEGIDGSLNAIVVTQKPSSLALVVIQLLYVESSWIYVSSSGAWISTTFTLEEPTLAD
jgi:hypothetical protein